MTGSFEGPAARGVEVKHHRGLVITLVVAVAVALVFVGVMALATNDTDESVHDELAPRQFGISAGEPQPNGQKSIFVFMSSDRCSLCTGRIVPLWDSWNDCVEADYTRERRFSYADKEIRLSVTTRCFLEHSQMHWRLIEDNGQDTVDVELHEDAGSGRVHAECGHHSGLYCSKYDHSESGDYGDMVLIIDH